MSLPVLPTVNAALNASAGVLLFCGWVAIKNKKPAVHKKFMIAAFSASVLFLCTYLYYHFTSGLTYYHGHGVWRAIYFFVLGTHTPLAVLIVPFIIMAIRYALRGEFTKHTRITKWLYPAWIYVSISGVLVYLMLFVFPAP